MSATPADRSQAKRGAIAAGHPQTAQAGADILSEGGNAVDAAVAAAFTSFVTEGALVNIGGGGIGMVVDPDSGRGRVYDFFSEMPSLPMHKEADFREVLIDFGPEQQPFHIGRASVAVPGVVAGLCAMADAHGALPLERLLAPAIHYARNGVLLTPQQAYVFEILQPIFQSTSELKRIYVPHDRPPRAGETMRFPALAATLQRLGREGAALFYQGEIARAIVADQEANGGLLAADDLAAYRVRTLEPLAVEYRGYTILLPPPSSMGGLLIGFGLRLLADLDVQALGHNSRQHLHLLALVMHLANCARREWDAGRNMELRTHHAEAFLAEERLRPYRRKLESMVSSGQIPPATAHKQDLGNTTHISVIDRHGMLASITTSAGENAGFVVGDTGVCLNNMLGELDLHPHGFHCEEPGERFTTMMTPVVVLHDGEPVLTVGSGGSSRIRSAILQVLSNVLDFGCPIHEAVHLPRIHFENGLLQIEGGIDDTTVHALEIAGFRINRWQARNMYFGGAHVVGVEAGQWVAAGDPRRGGATAWERPER